MIEPWLKAIREHPDRPPASQCWVLAMLATRLDWRTGQGFASERQLMADASAASATVKRATKWARDAGLLKEISRGHRLGDGRTRASEWALCISTAHQGAVDNDCQPLRDPISTAQPSGTSLPVQPSIPVNGSSQMSMVASRRARPAVEREFNERDKIDTVMLAAALRGWTDEAQDLSDEDALVIWDHFIGERITDKPVTDPVKFFYSAKTGTGVFSTFDYLDGVLGVTGTADEYEPEPPAVHRHDVFCDPNCTLGGV